MKESLSTGRSLEGYWEIVLKIDYLYQYPLITCAIIIKFETHFKLYIRIVKNLLEKKKHNFPMEYG